jgi:hypothetical protein
MSADEIKIPSKIFQKVEPEISPENIDPRKFRQKRLDNRSSKIHQDS